MLSPLSISEQAFTFLDRKDTQSALQGVLRGIEKEGLRVLANEPKLALSSHPLALGSALTNDWVTTDFSEALLEFITPAFNTGKEALTFLSGSHALASAVLAVDSENTEIIWPASMPCELPSDIEIPLAQYGSSNLATMKTTYRRGLGHRYGRAMQTVAGIHYNYSVPDTFWQAESEFSNQTFSQQRVSKRYLDLIRNFRRNYWLLIYLFGASPCADNSFATGRSHPLEYTAQGDLHLPYATSLRMGDLGYQSVAQKSLFICYNELSTYIHTLSNAMKTPYPPYNIFGMEIDGEYQQLSTALLQIENEFYSPIRPKRVTESGEKPLDALNNRGVEYIEVRCIDLNPYNLLGISQEDIDFMDVFLLSCLVAESPPCDQIEFAEIGENQSRVVNFGRQPDLELLSAGKSIKLTEAAKNILLNCSQTAAALDSANSTGRYSSAVSAQQKKVEDTNLTPSSILLDSVLSSQTKFTDYMHTIAKDYSKSHREYASQAKSLIQTLEEKAQHSLTEQKAIEDQDTQSFSEYLANYFAKA